MNRAVSLAAASYSETPGASNAIATTTTTTTTTTSDSSEARNRHTTVCRSCTGQLDGRKISHEGASGAVAFISVEPLPPSLNVQVPVTFCDSRSKTYAHGFLSHVVKNVICGEERKEGASRKKGRKKKRKKENRRTLLTPSNQKSNQ